MCVCLCVCVCVCVCVSNVRAHDYNFEDEIDLLFFEYSRFRDDFQERETKNTRKKNRQKKTDLFFKQKRDR